MKPDSQIEFFGLVELYHEGRLSKPLVNSYVELLSELSDRIYNLEDTYKRLVDIATEGRYNETVLWAVLEKQVVGTAQATLLNIATPKVYVNEVVVTETLRKSGIGHDLMSLLLARIEAKWPQARRIELTSSPKRNTRSFYERLGFQTRETDVYSMKL